MRTPGFSGADLENLLNEAALVAARQDKKKIDMRDIDEATDRVIAGPAKKSRVISKKNAISWLITRRDTPLSDLSWMKPIWCIK
ncbi:hypothetical protein AAGG52_00275 [Bacillus licheniformis]